MGDQIISLVLNLDTRPGFLEAQSTEGLMGDGVKSIDFFTEGIINKINFFRGFDTEVIVFIDQHEQLPDETIGFLHKAVNDNLIQSVVFSKHRTYFDGLGIFKWKDINILNALFLARGVYIAHFDMDAAAFCGDPSVISEWIEWLDSDTYRYISYPSQWSPKAVDDPHFDYMWASCRFFFCKRKTLQFDEITKCLLSDTYLYGKYGEKKSICPWLEHVLGIIDDGKVYYPPIELDRYTIFCFNHYKKGVLGELNNIPYSGVKEWIDSRGGISYPCDMAC